ncbi:4-alpha-glucanotransferase [Desulfosporosinus orientis DSM 765]|uniref:4-alpha-glucanotransferase n=1 Tax=Desulfosporosinus orientis (strain ATCC 19365 / DSM 765 / NCIMB 8382 / VKM B-1628 / Singapore I) TaxID=768706 RepID=G7WB96_DESOD|nr:bifunctional glycogen debranching protein GlgX/4-alpha-glucanotransferase [Desulfosporosinus orientis]AET67877.1 4-alpha-glucanotransferase [Desulfosporosinus orientis DSM 765]
MELKAYHNSHDLYYRKPFGAVHCGERIRFRFQISSSVPIQGCFLHLREEDWERSVPMSRISEGLELETELELESEGAGESGCFYETELEVMDGTGLVWYYFVINTESGTYYYGNNRDKLGGEGCLGKEVPLAYQITVSKPAEVPRWYRRGIMYQIFVDRFFKHLDKGFLDDSRPNALLHANWYDDPVYIKDEQGRVTDWDFFGGTLQGIIDKLPYFEELGVSILYLNPIFEAASNHKYDTADYLKIDPRYGDERTFAKLTAAAKEYGISIILDGVFSHTGADSIYFNKYNNYPELGAFQSPDSPYYSWYKFKSGQEYAGWWGVDSLPEVEEMTPSYRNFIYGGENSVVQQWLNLGAAGWRLDVADELPDEFIKELRQALKQVNSEAVLIGEVWEDASNKVSYGQRRRYFGGEELDAVMNYPFRASFLGFILNQTDAGTLWREMMSIFENYPRENFYGAMNLLGSHDTRRILTLLGEAPPEQTLTSAEQRRFRLAGDARDLGIQRLRLLSLIQVAWPGVPCIYYGDEVGLEGYADPYNRGTYPWGRENQEILQWYQRILRMRREYDLLQTGDFQPFFCDADVFGFSRAGTEETLTVLVNRHQGESKTVKFEAGMDSPELVVDLLTGEKLSPEELAALSVPALSAKALLTMKTQPHQLRLNRSCGILLHISSLPSSWGLGDLGKEAYDFIDFLGAAGQSLWQVLPLNPSGAGGCPYQSASVFAGNTMFISLDHLIYEGLLDLRKTQEKYRQLKSLGLRESLLKQAFQELKNNLLHEAYLEFRQRLKLVPNPLSQTTDSKYLSPENYGEFQRENKAWLEDFSLFRALKAHFDEAPWYAWEAGIARREPEALAKYTSLLQEERDFITFLQYTFFYEWDLLKEYAAGKGVRMIGDLPHFVAEDSCDVWVNRNLFKLSTGGRAAKIAGVPPDYFSKTGQLWGNPVYDWDELKKTDYAWWKMRLKFGLKQFDYLRLDHFRGFEAFWEVEAGEETAEKGRWMKGPGKDFLASLIAAFGQCPFIVEDLGIITPEVRTLKHIFGLPGVKVLQFSPLAEMSEDEDWNLVYYTGTHDNNTLLGWYSGLQPGTVPPAGDKGQACYQVIEELYSSQAAWVIVPMQDILGLGEEARMNVPGKVHGNWKWQLEEDTDLKEVTESLHNLAVTRGRV